MKRVLFLAILFAGCVSGDTSTSDTIPQKEIYQTYGVSYNAQDDLFSANAAFTESGAGGENLVLAVGSSITINGNAMNSAKRIFGGTYYVYESKGGPVADTGIFVFKDGEGRVFTNGYKIPRYDLDSVPAYFHIDSVYRILWTGPVLTDDFDLVLTIQDSVKTYQERVAYTRAGVIMDRETNQLILDSTILGRLHGISCRIQLEVNRESTLKESNEIGGDMFSRFVGRRYKVMLRR